MTTAEWSFRQDREAGRENRRSFRCAALYLVRTDAASGNTPSSALKAMPLRDIRCHPSELLYDNGPKTPFLPVDVV
jgi:hypothetical protein